MLTVDEQTDAALWLEATSGTEAAFAALFDRHRARVFRKAYGRTQHVADSEDIVAMVFLEAWRNRKKVRIVDGSILPWLLTTTSYVTMNQERSTRRYKKMLATLPKPADEPDHAPSVDDHIDGEIVTAALRKLPANDQRILDLCIIEDLPLATVAGVLELPLGTVKSRLNRAREKLRRALGETTTITTAIGAEA